MGFPVGFETSWSALGLCPSTHGGGGYAMGSYWRGTSIICGLCGTEIESPPPTGGYLDHYEYPSRFHKALDIGGKPIWKPKWPDWIVGERISGPT